MKPTGRLPSVSTSWVAMELCLHRSQPNRTREHRIGLAISYVPAHVQHVGSTGTAPAMLVRGTDDYGHFDLEPAPRGEFDDASLAVHAEYDTRYRANYNEQVALLSGSGG